MNITHFLLELNTDFKPVIVRRRKEFMELLLRCMVEEGNREAENDLFLRFGTKMVTNYDNGSTVAVMVDGEQVMRR